MLVAVVVVAETFCFLCRNFPGIFSCFESVVVVDGLRVGLLGSVGDSAVGELDDSYFGVHGGVRRVLLVT